MSAHLDRLALLLTHWVYPANQPSAFPFVVRRALVQLPLRALLVAYRCRRVMNRWWLS